MLSKRRSLRRSLQVRVCENQRLFLLSVRFEVRRVVMGLWWEKMGKGWGGIEKEKEERIFFFVSCLLN